MYFETTFLKRVFFLRGGGVKFSELRFHKIVLRSPESENNVFSDKSVCLLTAQMISNKSKNFIFGILNMLFETFYEDMPNSR